MMTFDPSIIRKKQWNPVNMTICCFLWDGVSVWRCNLGYSGAGCKECMTLPGCKHGSCKLVKKFFFYPKFGENNKACKALQSGRIRITLMRIRIPLSLWCGSGSCSQILCPWMGDIVDSGVGLSASPCSLAGQYGNPMIESTISPSQGLGFGY
jgi:hypothetical protein